MSQHRPVPRLDLAPKLRRPLSLWNPLDYLRLLYWVFYFPQALRWYVDAFGSGYIPLWEMNWRKGWELLHQNTIERQLLLQGLVLIVVTPLVVSVILQEIGVAVNWLGVVSGVTLGVASGMALSVVSGVALGVVSGMALGVASGVTLSAASAASGSELILQVILTLLVALAVSWSLRSGMTSGVALETTLGWKLFAMLGMVVGITLAIVSAVVSGVVVSEVVGFVALPWLLTWISAIVSGVVIFRPEDWLFGLLFALLKPWRKRWQFPHVTPHPMPFLCSQLQNWLRRDWKTGLHNANQLLTYTLQFVPVVEAINQVLREIPPQQSIFLVSQLAEVAEDIQDWRLVLFVSADLSECKNSGVAYRYIGTPAQAAAAGFFHLHEKEPAEATEAFAVVRPLLYGEEMFTLAQTLAAFHDAKKLASIAALQISASPPEPLLRPKTWETIISLRRIVKDVQVVQRSVSRYSRSSALNRALGQLKNILDNANNLPQAEQGLIVDIAQTWQNALLNVAGEVGEIAITEPVSNPYVVGDPVEGDLFVGREDVIRELKELWVRSRQLQSVVLYGHRRMGKTSILRNVAERLELGVWVAYVNLLEVGDAPSGVAEVLIAISDAISDTVQIPRLANDDLLNLPLPTFRRYFEQVVAELGEKGLIIALDEFEKIEELIEAKKIPIDFMGVLRGLAQKSSKVAFAFAGLHTLEEMAGDYFKPFYASVAPPIKIGFMTLEATHQILANPVLEDFHLDYTPEALDQIYTLTAGQPYLVQLVGFQLVRRYNDFVFEQGRPCDPVFTVEDVEAVINDPEFFKRGRYYFDGVWGQAARGTSGQQAILRALAPHPQGLSIDTLRTRLDDFVGANGRSPLPEETLQDALKTLTRHDVIQEREGRWQIIVELFRRWVLQT